MHIHSSPRALFASVAAALVASAVIAVPLADAAPHEAYLVIERLSATVSGDRVSVTVSVDAKSWEWAQKQRIAPEMTAELRLEGGKTLSQRLTLTKKEERLTLELARGAVPMSADVSFGGGDVRQRITSFTLAEARLLRARLAVTGEVRAPEPPPAREAAAPPGAAPAPAATRWAADPRVIDACGRAMDDRAACLDAIRDARVDPTPTIKACKRAFGDWDDDVQRCLTAVRGAPFEPAGMVLACKAGFGDFTASALDCVALGRRASTDPTVAIQACARADWEDEKVACLRAAFQ